MRVASDAGLAETPAEFADISAELSDVAADEIEAAIEGEIEEAPEGKEPFANTASSFACVETEGTKCAGLFSMAVVPAMV